MRFFFSKRFFQSLRENSNGFWMGCDRWKRVQTGSNGSEPLEKRRRIIGGGGSFFFDVALILLFVCLFCLFVVALHCYRRGWRRSPPAGCRWVRCSSWWWRPGSFAAHRPWPIGIPAACWYHRRLCRTFAQNKRRALKPAATKDVGRLCLEDVEDFQLTFLVDHSFIIQWKEHHSTTRQNQFKLGQTRSN